MRIVVQVQPRICAPSLIVWHDCKYPTTHFKSQLWFSIHAPPQVEQDMDVDTEVERPDASSAAMEEEEQVEHEVCPTPQ